MNKLTGIDGKESAALYIQTENGQVEVLVDAEDFDFLSRHTWNLVGTNGRMYAGTFFKAITGRQNIVSMHRMIIGGWSDVDHRNGNPLDNRKDNLRVATRNQNEWNKPKQKTSRGGPCTSKYKGVSLQSTGKWQAMIKRNGVLYQLGQYWNEEDAARAYNAKAAELSGDFTWLNPIPNINHDAQYKESVCDHYWKRMGEHQYCEDCGKCDSELV